MLHTNMSVLVRRYEYTTSIPAALSLVHAVLSFVVAIGAFRRGAGAGLVVVLACLGLLDMLIGFHVFHLRRLFLLWLFLRRLVIFLLKRYCTCSLVPGGLIC